MEDLKLAVSAAFEKVVASGAIEKAIEKQLGETIGSLIQSELRQYSDFGKGIQEKVSEALQVNLKALDLPSYSDMIGKIIRRQVDASMQSEFAVALEKNIADLLMPAPAEMTLEQLLASFIEHHKDYCGDGRLHGRPFTLKIDQARQGFTYISLDREESTPERDCEYHIGVHEGKVFSLRFGRKEVEKQLFVGPLYGFERELFRLHTAKSKLIIPEDASPHDYETVFPDPDD